MPAFTISSASASVAGGIEITRQFTDQVFSTASKSGSKSSSKKSGGSGNKARPRLLSFSYSAEGEMITDNEDEDVPKKSCDKKEIEYEELSSEGSEEHADMVSWIGSII